MWNPFRSLFEQRSIGSSAELLEMFTRGGTTIAGTWVTESTAFNVTAVHTAVSLIGRSVSSLPVRVIERLDGDQGKRPVPDHPIAQLLRTPHPWQTRQEFV